MRMVVSGQSKIQGMCNAFNVMCHVSVQSLNQPILLGNCLFLTELLLLIVVNFLY